VTDERPPVLDAFADDPAEERARYAAAVDAWNARLEERRRREAAARPAAEEPPVPCARCGADLRPQALAAALTLFDAAVRHGRDFHALGEAGALRLAGESLP
jgi:hypothetical protein